LIEHDYPAIPMAAVEHLIEFDPPSFDFREASRHLPNPAQPGETVTVKVLPGASSKVDVSEDASVYHFGLGRRRIEITRAEATTESTATVTFKWGFDNNAGANLSPERSHRTGGADLQRGTDGWHVVRTWRMDWNEATGICE